MGDDVKELKCIENALSIGGQLTIRRGSNDDFFVVELSFRRGGQAFGSQSGSLLDALRALDEMMGGVGPREYHE